MTPWSAPDHMRKQPRNAAASRTQSGALAPVWVEADELRAFKAWWDRRSDAERNARSAFLHGLQQSDAAWGVVYKTQGDELQRARESLRVVEKELAGMRGANERLERNSTERSIART